MDNASLSQRLPTEDEKQGASAAVTALATMVQEEDRVRFPVQRDGRTLTVELPPAVTTAVIEYLSHIARGEMVTIVPYGADLTTQEAADILNVSRPFLTKLLDEGSIPHIRVGSHRRVKAEDVLTYKDERDSSRSEALAKMQRLGQEFD